MANWTEHHPNTADAKGVWMRTSSLIEHIPSFPGVIDEVEPPSSFDSNDTEVTDTSSEALGSFNRAPLTDPPPPRRTLRPLALSPAPAPLYDEAPDPAEHTPPTWDMGLLPATYADAEVTEESDRFSSKDITHLAQKAALVADVEQSVTLELLDDWMEHADQLQIEAAPQVLLPHAAPQAIPNRTATPTPRRRTSSPHSTGFDGHAVTRPLARAPISLQPAPSQHPSAFERAGWWAAGALSGMIGASVLTAMMLAIVLLA